MPRSSGRARSLAVPPLHVVRRGEPVPGGMTWEAAIGRGAVVFYRRGRIAVFLHIFPKSGKANLRKSELADYLEAARVFEKLSENELLASRDAKRWRVLEI